MYAARRAHAHGHAGIPIARRQLDLPPGLRNKPQKQNRPDPPGRSDKSSTPPPESDQAPPAPPANQKSTPAANYEGGGYDINTSTSSTTQTRTTTTSSLTPSPSRNPSQGLTGYGAVSNAGVADAGSGSSGSDSGGLSSDFTLGTVTSTPDSSPPTPVATTGNLSGVKSSPSGGPIAAAVIVSLLFVIAIVVFILRRRSKARRDEQAIKWGFTQNRTSESYGDDEHFSFRNSNRSSFATTFDHSSTAVIPPPPMAEVGRPNGTAPALIMDTNADQNRFSIGSAHSDNSQFLVVHHRKSVQPENWASVAEYTESFTFPKPPLADCSSLHSKTSECSRTAFPRREEPEVLYVASPPGVQSTTPFLRITQPAQPSPLLTNPFADKNPFDDPATLSVPLTETSLQVQTVRRPFFPQLQDEMQVIIGDSVRIVQIFDDGWALVEKVSPTPQCDLGLIPLECLRDPVGPNLLMGGKRTSSQSVKKA